MFGFTGESILPSVVAPAIGRIIIRLATMCPTDLWGAFLKEVANDSEFLKQTAVGIIYGDNGSVRTREIGCHNPPYRVLGARFRTCFNIECKETDAIFFKNKFTRVTEFLQMKCSHCQYKSDWVSIDDIPWANTVPGNRRASWHEYPLNLNQLLVFAVRKKTGGVKRKHNGDT